MTINGDGEQRRDFTYVGDVVNANILASQSENVGNGEVINIGNGDNRSINDIADMIGGERIHREPVIEPKETLADNSLAEKLLGWKPTQNIEDWVPGYKKELGLDV
jgi:UDP-glucose 4-epimerase